MEGAQRDAYELAAHEGRVYLKELGEKVTVAHVLARLQVLKRLCNRDPESGESAKLDLLKDELEDVLAEGSKALIYSQYVGEGVDIISERFAQHQPAIVTGQVGNYQREIAIERFQDDDKCKIFVATQKTGGVGLNLIRGNYVFHFDHWWNPATAAQAEDRVHRIGQTKDVFVFHFWTEDTVEDRIHKILERKQRLYSDVIDDLSNVKSSGLSEDELFELFDLKRPTPKKKAYIPSDGQPLDIDALLALTPEQFELTVEQLYQALGYGTRRTPLSRDGGVDVIASRATMGGGNEKLAIQCKCYELGNKVGRPYAQALLGVVTADRSYTKGVIVTTSEFSPDCRQFAYAQGNLELMNGQQLLQIMKNKEFKL